MANGIRNWRGCLPVRPLAWYSYRFPSRSFAARYLTEIAWETEVVGGRSAVAPDSFQRRAFSRPIHNVAGNIRCSGSPSGCPDLPAGGAGGAAVAGGCRRARTVDRLRRSRARRGSSRPALRTATRGASAGSGDPRPRRGARAATARRTRLLAGRFTPEISLAPRRRCCWKSAAACGCSAAAARSSKSCGPGCRERGIALARRAPTPLARCGWLLMAAAATARTAAAGCRGAGRADAGSAAGSAGAVAAGSARPDAGDRPAARLLRRPPGRMSSRCRAPGWARRLGADFVLAPRTRARRASRSARRFDFPDPSRCVRTARPCQRSGRRSPLPPGACSEALCGWLAARQAVPPALRCGSNMAAQCGVAYRTGARLTDAPVRTLSSGFCANGSNVAGSSPRSKPSASSPQPAKRCLAAAPDCSPAPGKARASKLVERLPGPSRRRPPCTGIAPCADHRPNARRRYAGRCRHDRRGDRPRPLWCCDAGGSRRNRRPAASAAARRSNSSPSRAYRIRLVGGGSASGSSSDPGDIRRGLFRRPQPAARNGWDLPRPRPGWHLHGPVRVRRPGIDAENPVSPQRRRAGKGRRGKAQACMGFPAVPTAMETDKLMSSVFLCALASRR